MAKKDVCIMVCMTSEDKDRLKAQARKENRSVSNLARKVIKDYLAQEDARPQESTIAPP